MTETEKLARRLCEFDGRDPKQSLGCLFGDFLWMEYHCQADGMIKAGVSLNEGPKPPEFIYALFKDGKQISNTHSTHHITMIEAYHRGAVVHNNAKVRVLALGYEIRELKTHPSTKHVI